MKTTIKQSAYEILAVTPQATAKEIKRQYKKMIRVFTPEHAPEKFIEIRDAYEKLTKTIEAFDKMPIYKKPLLFLQEQNQTEGAAEEQGGFSEKLLNTIFETPFNTAQEVKDLFKEDSMFSPIEK